MKGTNPVTYRKFITLKEPIFGLDNEGGEFEIRAGVYDFDHRLNTTGLLEGFILDDINRWLWISENPASDNIFISQGGA